MKQIGMETAWNTSTGSSSVVVAVIDSGIDTTHPDLQSNLWVNRGEIPGNGRDDDGNGYVDDVNGWNAAFGNGDVQDVFGHGTHVSGTIAAAGNNAIGVVGVNWQAKIMAVDVDAITGGGIIGIDEGLAYVIKQKQLGTNVVAINASYGGPGFSQAAKDLYALAGRVGITVVAAAGNAGTNNTLSPGYPASYDLSNIISVAATDQTDALAEFSNFGKASVDLGAPGVGILSTLPRSVLASDFNPTDTNNDSVPLGYGYLDGTSMATPHVTGAVALLKAIKPSRHCGGNSRCNFGFGSETWCSHHFRSHWRQALCCRGGIEVDRITDSQHRWSICFRGECWDSGDDVFNHRQPWNLKRNHSALRDERWNGNGWDRLSRGLWRSSHPALADEHHLYSARYRRSHG